MVKLTILLKETDTKNLLEESKKKSKTEDLVKEANELAEKSKTDKVIEKCCTRTERRTRN